MSLFGNGVAVRARIPVPFGRMTYTRLFNRQQLLENAMSLPSGDQVGANASREGGLTAWASVPSARITQTWLMIPLKSERAKAIHRPSGDTEGWMSSTEAWRLVMARRCVPSTRIE